MFSEFKVITTNKPSFTLIQPPAGILPLIHKRVGLYTKEDGTLDGVTWNGIFVLACLHKDGVSVVNGIIIPSPTVEDPNAATSFTSVRQLFAEVSDADFKAVVKEFLFQLNRDDLDYLYDLVDADCLISKKAKDEVKND